MLSAFIRAMQFQSRFLLTSVFLACGLGFAQPGFSQLTSSAALATAEDATSDENNEDSRASHRSSGRSRPAAITPDGTQLPDADADLSTALVTSPIETAQLIIEGTDVNPVEYPALPEVQGTRINSGKKTSFVKPEEFPSIANNDYREALATTPGLLVSEEPSSPIVNFGYRGLDSQRSEFMQVLKDGVSIKNEQFGFPESHYTPILDAVERIEFIRAGAALQFGPQPGGALNFVMKMPRRDVQFEFETKNVFGSDGLYQNYTSVGGTVGRFGYYAYFDHRERDGFRTNSAYDLNAGSAKLVFDATDDSRFILTLDAYEEEHGEPGGLTEVPAPGASLYQVDRNASTRLYDLFRLKRYYGMLEYQKAFSERTQLEIKAFGGYLQRYSQRQRGGGFGVAPDPNPAPGSAASTDDIQDREDYTEGVEMRFRHDYDLARDTSTFTGGMYFYHALQDRRDERGTTPNASSGLLRRFNTGETTNFALFAENRFKFGRLSITPGMRLEFFGQSLDEHVNITRAPGDPLLSQSDFSFVPLFSLSAGYVLVEGQVPAPVTMSKEGGKSVANAASMVAGGPPRLELYATVAQAYRPRTYGELVPTAPDGVVNGDLKEGDSIQFELGVRGKPLPYLTFDVGGFYFEVNDQVGEISGVNAAGATFTTTQNVGDARYAGFEGAAELDLLGMINGGTESPYGRFNLYGNITLLNAEFTSGPNEGFDTTYAPDYQFKIGSIYRWKEAVKVGLIGNLVDDSFADANNTKSHFIPAYTVWDLTAEVKFLDGRLGVFAGIKNLFDEDFYAEIRDEGIVPAYRRNYYGGFSVKF